MRFLPHGSDPSFEAGPESSGGSARFPEGAEDDLRYVCKAMEGNWRFLKENAQEVLEEIVGLFREGIAEHLGLVLDWPEQGLAILIFPKQKNTSLFPPTERGDGAGRPGTPVGEGLAHAPPRAGGPGGL